MAQKLFARGLVCILGVSIISSYSFAGYSVNAMCYLEDKSGAVTQPLNITAAEAAEEKDDQVTRPTKVTAEDTREKFRIASLSKILVTHWAVAKLGLEYRFKTKVSISATAPDKTCHVHFSGDQDIFFGKEMLQKAFTQLDEKAKAQGCATVKQVSYDEKLVIPFHKATGTYVIQHRDDRADGFRDGDPDNWYGPITTQSALLNYVKKFAPARFKGSSVGPVNSVSYEEYLKTATVKSYSFKSRPLYMMMREFNAYSFNIPPNILFEKLGGTEAYSNFIENRLGIRSQVSVKNGSGYPINSTKPDRFDNTVSCNAFVRIVQDLDHMIKAYKGSKQFQLADVMPVGGKEELNSTLKHYYGGSVFQNTIAGKTGTANEAITFGGMLSTSEGAIYFAVYTNPDSLDRTNAGLARSYIRDVVTLFIGRLKLKAFNYEQIGAMTPTDDYANFVEETKLNNKLN
ncbi:hypothetical protein [Bdellovibrio reynosensis]|uniref:D-alanyl-D-alanine carboxypeptidase n=1 Tax=Bdellovibrio reynosensis TaxID=2835041 RepID=A0ABY4C752_9BACT|nr:hypothetical protein [Bdellovibrio reynosensis]UOF00803.1 hypothetical protein MNR06_13960 [Bdellovibrio reynosensis]